MKNSDFDKWLNDELSDEDDEIFNAQAVKSVQEFQLKEQFKERLKARRLWRSYFNKGLISLALLAILGFIGFKMLKRPVETSISTKSKPTLSETTPPLQKESFGQYKDSFSTILGSKKVLKNENDKVIELKKDDKNVDNSLVLQPQNTDVNLQNPNSTTDNAVNNEDKKDNKNEKPVSDIDPNLNRQIPTDLTPLEVKKKEIPYKNTTEIDLKNPATYVDLTKQRLTEIPPNIFRLEQLQTLLVPNNQIVSLPSAIGDLVKLQVLDVSKNKVKNLPETLGKLTSLTSLNISNNQLEALPSSIGNLSFLTFLNAAKNKITDFPLEIYQLSKLNHLDLSGNRLKILPDGIHQLSQLTWLSLRDNKLKNLPMELINLENLTYLDMSFTGFNELPTGISNLSRLDTLMLSSNLIRIFPTEICNFTDLKYLNLNHNALSHIPEEIGNLTQLMYLDLSHNQLSDLPEQFNQLVNLKVLDLRFNDFGKKEIERLEELLPNCKIKF
jgi:Leucine-rich repeat (LRR) protein